uniref:Nicotianamine synthase n=1 Tax=Oryza punctata TaxID=4537 RepID=A0A0E0K0X1_ORYPU
MEAQSQEVAALLRKIAGLLAAIDNLAPSRSPSPARAAFVGSGPTSLVLAARHMLPRAHFDIYNYDRCGAASDDGAAARVSFRTADDDVADLELQARDLATYDVVFLVAAASAGKAEAAVAHLGRHMAAGAALVVDVDVEPEVVARAGFDVLAAVCHPDGDSVTNSAVIVARKAADEPRRNGNTAAPYVVRLPILLVIGNTYQQLNTCENFVDLKLYLLNHTKKLVLVGGVPIGMGKCVRVWVRILSLFTNGKIVVKVVD